MPKCTIDGVEVEFQAGTNLIDVAKSAGIEIPYFCYHPGLSVVAQCRMCAVEIEKMPKLQTACSTNAADGMVVHTRSDRAKQNQKAIMEFLLINHPLDCPVCDKAGECDLQDFSFNYGDAYSRYTEERRTYVDLDMGPVIKKNMNRCIHCTRCIRFGTEVAGIHEMVAIQRGGNTEITTIDGRPLETDYAGNYADVCPTGSLTLKDFRFKKRVWYLKKTPSVCEGCSRGCAIELHQDANVVHRTLPRENLAVNKYWLCDEGRFNYRYVNDPSRVTAPMVGGKVAEWTAAIDHARTSLKGKNVSVLVGTDLTTEEMTQIREFVGRQFPDAAIMHFGTPGITTTAQDGDEDKILKRLSKTANLNGAEKLGIKPFTALPAGASAALIFRGGRAALPQLKGVTVVGAGVFFESESAQFAAILPGLSWAEKDGTFTNFQGTDQRIKRSIAPVGECKATSEVMMLWTNSKTSTVGAGSAVAAGASA